MQWNIFQLIISDRRVKLQRLRPHPKEPTKFPATFISVNGNCFITITVLSMSFGVNVHRALSTPVWIENALSAEWNPGFVYNMECERIPCSRPSDSKARCFYLFIYFFVFANFLPRSTVWRPGTGQAASERIYVQYELLWLLWSLLLL